MRTGPHVCVFFYTLMFSDQKLTSQNPASFHKSSKIKIDFGTIGQRSKEGKTDE